MKALSRISVTAMLLVMFLHQVLGLGLHMLVSEHEASHARQEHSIYQDHGSESCSFCEQLVKSGNVFLSFTPQHYAGCNEAAPADHPSLSQQTFASPAVCVQLRGPPASQ